MQTAYCWDGITGIPNENTIMEILRTERTTPTSLWGIIKNMRNVGIKVFGNK